MSEALQQFHFLRPWYLLALLALPLLWWLGSRRSQAQLALSRLVDAELLPHLLRGRAGRQNLPLWLSLLAWSLAGLAIAGPTWSHTEQPLYSRRAAQVVAISLSQQMLARDVSPSRIARARYKAHELLNDNRDGLNALIGYAGEAFVVAPLTSDAHSLSDLLDAMSPDTMPVDGNDAAAAIRRAVKLIHDSNTSGGSLILITDNADAEADAAARKALAADVHVSVLGVGTTQGGPVPLAQGGFLHDANGNMALGARDDAALTALARAGGGRYVAMSANHHDIDVLHGQLHAGRSKAVSGQQGDQWQDRGPWLLLPLLLIVALGFRRGWLMLLPLVLLPLIPAPAHAGTWQDLWQRRDQQAAQALRDGHPKQAQQLAKSPALRGAAAYRAGDYAVASQTLQPVAGTDAAYNRGNALARQQQYQQAIKAYDQALKLDPHNADAQANRKAVQDWLKQQEKQKQQNPKKKPQGKGQDKQNKPGQQGKDDQGKGQGKDGKDGHDGKSSGKDKDNPAKPSSLSNNSSSKDQPPSPDKGKNGQSNPADDKGKPSPGQKAGDDKNQNQANSPDKDQGKDGDQNQAKDQPKPPSAKQQAQQKAAAAKAQQALKQQMDKALAGKPDSASKIPPPAHQLGAMSAEDPQSKLPADVRRELQRVQDDPGALLRRKFQLEYQQRHGGAQDEDEQP